MVFTLIFLLAITASLADVADVTDISLVSISACVGESKTLYCKHIDYQKSLIRFKASTSKQAKTWKTLKAKKGKYGFEKNGTLTLKNIETSDAGIYRYSCKYNTRCWKNNSHTACYIKLEIRNCEMKRVHYGSMATMVCKANRPNTDIKEIKWVKFGKPRTVLAIDGSITNETEKMYSGRLRAVDTALTIKDTKTHDEGIYICQLEYVERKNDYRKPRSSYSFHLTIEGAPANTTTNATVSPVVETAESPTKVNISTLTADTSTVTSTVTSPTMPSTIQENKTEDSTILAAKSPGARVQGTDCMVYMISSVLMVTYIHYKLLIPI